MGQHHYDLDIVIGCLGLPMNGETIPSGQPLGGSETCAIQQAEALARQGHRPVIFCNTDRQSETNGVVYLPMGWAGNGPQQFPKGYFDYVRGNPFDVLVAMRVPSMLQFETQAKVNLLWQHDLATKTGPSQFGPLIWNIDKIMVISQFMKQQYQGVHGGLDELYHVTRNGIDLSLIDAVPEQPRDRFKLMFTARPERGLDILLRAIWPEVIKREPRARLYISRYNDPASLPLYEQLAQLAAQYGETVVNLGHLGKQELYKHYKQARAFLYSSVFEEVSCLTVQEFGACGGVFIGPWKAALPETCAGNHILIRDEGTIGRGNQPVDPGFRAPTQEFIRSFIEQTVGIMHDDQRWEQLSRGARQRAEQWTWDPVATEWVDLIHQLIEKKSGNHRRLFKHFLAKSDVVAAKKYAETINDDTLQKSVERYVDRFVPFMKETEPEKRKAAIAAFYEARSGGAAADYRTAFWADQEQRCHMLLGWLNAHKDEIKSLLDFGCAHGGYVRAISNTLPALSVLGADVSPTLIRCANELLTARLPDGQPAFQRPEHVQFFVADEDSDINGLQDFPGACWVGEKEIVGEAAKDLAVAPAQFDCVVCMDTLEHLPHLEEVVAKLERHCKPGGWMVFTVPYGNRERDEFVNKGVPPVHVRSFDQHDIMELFGHRQDFTVTAFSDLTELELDRSFAGWFMVSYRRDDQAVGEINWKRKFFLQAPRETLSVCLITHNNEDVLHRCLRSVMKVADQVIVADNGPSSDRTVEVAGEYTPEVIAATSPFWCRAHMMQHGPREIQPGVCEMAGFETPRNESIAQAWGDWILWIDSDEQLLETRALWKYLRANVLIGYAVPQHHISIEPAGVLKRDLPVRIFRNNVGMRCIGLVHEHFELGLNKGVGSECIMLPDVHIHHDGYLTEPIRRGRFWRNYRLLQCDRAKYPDRMLGIFLYDLRDNVHMAKYALESNGGVITPEVQQYLGGVITAFRTHFLRSCVPVLLEDALAYYSEALNILGQGREVLVSMDVRPVGAQQNPGVRFRCADEAEAEIIVGNMLKTKFAPLEGPYVQ